MKEKIYTIPVNEAFEEADSCPLCTMIKKLEAARVKYMLGPAMMEPDIRTQTNSIGFCKRHYEMMFAQENKLSLALILQTHLEEINQKISAQTARIANQKPLEKSIFKKRNTDTRGNAVLLSRAVQAVTESCVICEHINSTFERYIDTLFYMWQSDPAFKERFASTSSFCLEHYALLAKYACRYLSDADALAFLKQLNEIEEKHLVGLKADVDRFILKFDYRSKDLPWENAKDAPKRALQTLSGTEIE